jgi:HlyD family secretion protein
MKKFAIGLAIVLFAIIGFGALSMQQRMAAAAKKPEAPGSTVTVERGDLTVTVVETGKIAANEIVEVKSRATGRLAQLLVKEGDRVTADQLIAVVDPQETRLRVEQDEAQLRGAQTVVDRSAMEIEQRRITAQAAYDQAVSRVRELQMELKAQPILTQAAIRQAETALASAQEERKRLVQSIHPTQRTNSESAVREAKANWDNAKLDFDRQTELAKKGYVAGRAADSARLTMDLANVRLQQAQDNLAKLEAQLRAEVAKQDEAIRQAQAELTRARANRVQDDLKKQALVTARAAAEQARAALRDPEVLAKQREQSMATVAQLSSALRDSQRQLGETEIKSPINGIVVKKGLNVGEMATGLSTFSSGSTIVTLEDRTSMRVKLQMNEIDVAKLELGMPAKVVVDALPKSTFAGTVKKIAPASIDSTNASATTSADAVVRYEVEIYLDEAPEELRSGMTAKCTLDVLKRNQVLTIPAEFVGQEGDQSFVMLKATGERDKPRRVSVKVGAKSGSKVEIEGAVRVGDKLVKPDYKGPQRKGAMQFGGDEE